MLRFDPADMTWWQKPLVQWDGRLLPAELVVLQTELGEGEQGVWINSRGTKTGVSDLIPVRDDPLRDFKTHRIAIPLFVAASLNGLYSAAGVSKGCPDLVIWHEGRGEVRLVEVKCPHWDSVTPEQEAFMRAAESQNVPVSVVEWEFSREPRPR